MTLPRETNYTTRKSHSQEGCEDDDVVFAFSASDDMLETLSGITPRLLRPSSALYRRRDERQGDHGSDGLANDDNGNDDDYLSFIASPRPLMVHPDEYSRLLRRTDSVKESGGDGGHSSDSVFYAPRVNFVTGESPSSANSKVSQRTVTLGTTSDSVGTSIEIDGADNDCFPGEFSIFYDDDDDDDDHDTVETSRPKPTKSLTTTTTTTFGVDPREFSCRDLGKSYESIIDSFANVAQQNYKLWLNRV